MRRSWCVLLCLALLLAGCGGGTREETTSWSPLQMADAVAQSQETLPQLWAALPGDRAFELALTELYGIPAEDVADGAILTPQGAEAAEIAVLRLTEDGDRDEASRRLLDYLDRRTADFTGYFPEQEALLRGGTVAIRGRYVALLVCPDMEEAKNAFERCFRKEAPAETPDYPALDAPEPTVTPEPTESPAPTDDPVPTEPPAEWSYDHDRLLAAWETGDRSGLWEKDLDILDMAEELLEEARAPGQSLPELELAVHDLLVDRMSYDTATIERYAGTVWGGTPDPDNENPYGALIGGKGICRGYTSTFQLLMDMAGIECISVSGHSDNGEEYGEHAWNQVRLDGDWYIVDVTWDDPLSSRELPPEYHHRYFNVTAKDIRHNHFWDEDSVPEATGTAYNWAALR